MYILGVDGGGTKTTASLFHIEKGFIWSTETEPTNPHSTSFTHSVQTIIQIIETAYQENELSKLMDVYLCLGIAGLGRKEEQKEWSHLFRESSAHLPGAQEIVIGNDGEIALYSTTLGMDGIVSICGTGSLTFGVNGQHTARIGGWGHLIGGDPGSGYHMGFQALAAVFHAKDGLSEKTCITDLLLEKESVHHVEQLIPIIYKHKNEKQRIAAYATCVCMAAKEGDRKAIAIMKQTANEVARRGEVLYQKLFDSTPSKKAIPFVLAGSVYHNEQFVQYVVAALKSNPRLSVTLEKESPVIGSIVMGLKRKGYSAKEMKGLLKKGRW